jgi:hypothetical protein
LELAAVPVADFSKVRNATEAKQLSHHALAVVEQHMSSDWTVRPKPLMAVGLLKADALKALGPSLTDAWPVDDTPCFQSLLQAIDQADRASSSEAAQTK